MNTIDLLYLWIGKRIAYFRKAKNFSQTKLAELLQMSRGSIANIEKGRQQPPLHVLWNIAEQLDVPIVNLIPIQNEHMIQDTDELIIQVNDMDDLNEENKKLITQFLEKNL